MNKRRKKMIWFWVDIFAKVILFIAVITAMKLVFFK